MTVDCKRSANGTGLIMHMHLTPDSLCSRCGKRTVEVIAGNEYVCEYISDQCSLCNDKDIERAYAREEWDYYHD